MPVRVLAPLRQHIECAFLVFLVPWFVSLQVHKFSKVELFGILLVSATFKDDPALARLDLLQLVEALLLLNLPLHRLDYLDLSQVSIALDGLHEDESPPLELILGLEGDLDDFPSRCRDLHQELVVLAAASHHLGRAEVYKPAWSSFSCKKMTRRHRLD